MIKQIQNQISSRSTAIKIFVISSFILLVLNSCKKEKVESGTKKDSTNLYPDNFYDSNVNFYAVGIKLIDNGFTVPMLWKNGIPTILDSNRYGNANAVFAYGNDVYVAGNINVPGSKLTIWKNGTPEYWTSGDTSCLASSMCVYNGDVYVVGYRYASKYSSFDTTRAMLWKNGKELQLSDSNSRALSIKVNETGVYIAGYETWGKNKYAVLWKNGKMNKVSDSPSVATSIFLYGNDVYVGGSKIYYYDQSIGGTIWKNGVDTRSLSMSSRIDDIFVESNSIYAVSSNCVWKNGQVIYQPPNTAAVSMYSCFVLNSKLYVGGSYRKLEDNKMSIATLWNDGVISAVSDGWQVYSVYVTHR